MSARVWLSSRVARSVTFGHPWVFASAITKVEGRPALGDRVALIDERTRAVVGQGLYNPEASLRVRVYSRKEGEDVDSSLFRRRIKGAVELRHRLFGPSDSANELGLQTNAYRLLNGENDGISGLVVDKYADHLVLSVSAKVIEQKLEELIEMLKQETVGEGQELKIHIKKVDKNRERENLNPKVLQALSSPLSTPLDHQLVATDGQPINPDVLITQRGLRYAVSLREGQKSGFYLDQWLNRERVAAHAHNRDVLSCYCYTGGFEIAAAKAGAASVLGIDSSVEALRYASVNHQLNGTNESTKTDYLRGDVPTALRKFRDEKREFDLIVLDPPRLVDRLANKPNGLKAYKDMNLQAMQLLRPGGILATFSCSGLVTADDLLQVIRLAAKDAGVSVQVLEQLGHPPDHPVFLNFVEGAYLNGYILRINGGTF